MSSVPEPSFALDLLLLGSIGFVISLIGLPFVLPLLMRRSSVRHALRFNLIDLAFLLAMVGPITLLIWSMFPEGDERDGTLYVIVFLLLFTIWWAVGAVSLSRIGVSNPARRAVYLLAVVPFAFLSPVLAYMFAMEALASAFGPPGDAAWLGLALCGAAYFVCIPLTLWVTSGHAKRP